jgi:hypothetical protein
MGLFRPFKSFKRAAQEPNNKYIAVGIFAMLIVFGLLARCFHVQNKPVQENPCQKSFLESISREDSLCIEQQLRSIDSQMNELNQKIERLNNPNH